MTDEITKPTEVQMIEARLVLTAQQYYMLKERKAKLEAVALVVPEEETPIVTGE